MSKLIKVPPFFSGKGEAEKGRLMKRLIIWQQDEVAELFTKWLTKKIEGMYKADEKAVADSTTEFQLQSKLIENLHKRAAYREILNIIESGETNG